MQANTMQSSFSLTLERESHSPKENGYKKQAAQKQTAEFHSLSFFLRLLKTKRDKTNLCHTEKWFLSREMFY